MTVKHEARFGTVRRGWAGIVLLAGWLAVAAAFAGDLVPTSDPGDWLYGVEARRDATARALSLREAEARRSPEPPPMVAATAGGGARAN